MSKPINPNQKTHRRVLVFIGGALLLGGIALMLTALLAFASAFTAPLSPGGGPPEGIGRFFLAFLGIPMMFVGGLLLKFGLLGSIARYSAGEIVPVATDSFNYAVDQTKDGVRNLSSAVREGVSGGTPAESVEARLAQLKDLRDKGLIDEADYQAQQDRILAEL